LDRKP